MTPPTPRPALAAIISTCPRTLWDRLLDDVLATSAEARTRPELLARPVRVVVASRVQRERVAAELVARAGGGLVGVEILTLWALTRQLLEGAGRPAGGASFVLPLIVRRAMREGRLISAALGDLDDGWRPLWSTLRDLIDAGLEPGEAVAAALAELDGPGPGSPAALARARELVEMAAEVAGRCRDLGLVLRGEAYRQAAEVLRADPEGALPSRRALVYGFPNATGRAADLIEALVSCLGATAYLDEPADPAGSAGPDPRAAAFVGNMRKRVSTLGAVLELEGAASETSLVAVCAHGREEEIRELAARVEARRASASTAWERTAVVSRRMDGDLLAALRRVLSERGLPFTGPSLPASHHPHGRLAAAVLRLLRERAEVPTDVWLDALASRREGAGPLGTADPEHVRAALKLVGAGSLAQAAELASDPFVSKRWARLPGPSGAVDPDEPEGDERDSSHGRPRFLRARIPAEEMAAVWELIGALAEALAATPGGDATLAEHARWARDVIAGPLGWSSDDPLGEALLSAVDKVAEEAPPELRCEAYEAALAFEESLGEIGATPSGGRGGGLCVLSAEQARGVPFEVLHLVGLERGSFPAAAREDPLLGDDVRERLGAALTELRSSEARRAEERYLFAHLLGMANEVTLSWRSTDGEGRPTAPSPLLERLRLAGRVSLPESATAAFPLGFDPTGTRPGAPTWAARPWAAGPAAVLLAGNGAGPWLQPVWQRLVGRGAQLRAMRNKLPTSGEEDEAKAYARLRGQVLGVLERPPKAEALSGSAALAPWYGAVGPWPVGAHEATGEVWATRLEAVARCPWQTFLSRGLGLEAPPDAVDGLPDIEARVVGDAAHAALAALLRPGPVVARDGATLDDLVGDGPALVPPPSHSAVERAVRSTAQHVARREGYGSSAVMERVLAALSRPFVERGVELLWKGKPLSVVAPEVETNADGGALEGGAPLIRFRADAALVGGERLRLVDFKTGRGPFFRAKKSDTRVARLETQMRQGRWLQGALYALAESAHPVSGEYLFLQPDHELDEARVTLVRPEDGRLWLADGSGDPIALDVPVAEVVAAVTAMWRDGLLPPRLEVPDRPGRAPGEEPVEVPANRICEWCEVKTACVRGDSGHRLRLRHRAFEAWRRWHVEPERQEDGLIARLFRGDLGPEVGDGDG